MGPGTAAVSPGLPTGFVPAFWQLRHMPQEMLGNMSQGERKETFNETLHQTFRLVRLDSNAVTT